MSDLKTLQDIMDCLVKARLRMAVAESLTCGGLQSAIGSISGASNFFEGGITVYNLDQKVRLLGVNREHAKSVNSVSPRVADELACCVCSLFGADIGIGTTGYAEPDQQHGIDKPMAYFAIWQRTEERAWSHVTSQVFGEGLTRIEKQQHVVDSVLKALTLFLGRTL